jgi:hypothetical protein
VRFEVRNPTGPPHEVELEGTLATLGRDPTCDLVLNDPKCSRRHAVVEAGPDGLAIRDAGSANGIFVNGKKTDRSPLQEGDVIRLGDVSITVLAEEVPGTLVMGPEDVEDMEVVNEDPSDTRPDGPSPLTLPPPPQPRSPVPAPPPVPPPAPPRLDKGPAAVPPPPRQSPPPPPQPPPPPPQSPPAARARVPAAAPHPPMPPPPAPPRPSAPHAPPRTSTVERPRPQDEGRPLTVTLLMVLWALSVLLFPLVAVLLARTSSGPKAAAAVGLGIFMAVISAAMAYGMWALASWARTLQIVLAAIGTITCFHPFSIASMIVLVYMLRPPAKHHFGAGSGPAPPADATTDMIVAGALLAAVVLGVLVTAALTFLVGSAQSVSS